MLSLLTVASSANSIAKLRKAKIEYIFNSTKGNKITISAKELKNLAKKSIGNGDENLKLVMQTLIKRLMMTQELIKLLEDKIEKYVDDSWSDQFEILTSIKGIGKVTSQKFLIEVEDISNFSNHKQLTAFAGTDPSIKQSGNSVYSNGRITKRGNKYLIKTLYQMAESCVRHSETFNKCFRKKREEKKKFKQAIIAVANKLIRIIFALLTKGEIFVESI